MNVYLCFDVSEDTTIVYNHHNTNLSSFYNMSIGAELHQYTEVEYQHTLHLIQQTPELLFHPSALDSFFKGVFIGRDLTGTGEAMIPSSDGLCCCVGV